MPEQHWPLWRLTSRYLNMSGDDRFLDDDDHFFLAIFGEPIFLSEHLKVMAGLFWVFFFFDDIV